MSKVIPGRMSARMVKAQFVGNGDQQLAAAFAAGQRWDDSQLVAASCKGIIGAMSTADIAATAVAYDFSQAVRARSVLSRIPGVVPVPAYTRILSADTGSQAAFVPEGGAIKLTKFEMDGVVLPELKVTGLCALTEELVQNSSPAADALIAVDLLAAGAEAIDRALLDVGAGVANERPASIFYGAHSQASTGSTFAAIDSDLTNALQYMVSVGSDLRNAIWTLRPETAIYLSALRDTAGTLAYPDLTPLGGVLRGLPAIVSSSMPEPGSPPLGYIGLVDGSQLAVVDQGAAQIAVSRNATIQMLDNPGSSSVSGTPANAVSLFQTNTVAVRSTHWVNWFMRRAHVTVISGVTY